MRHTSAPQYPQQQHPLLQQQQLQLQQQHWQQQQQHQLQQQQHALLAQQNREQRPAVPIPGQQTYHTYPAVHNDLNHPSLVPQPQQQQQQPQQQQQAQEGQFYVSAMQHQDSQPQQLSSINMQNQLGQLSQQQQQQRQQSTPGKQKTPSHYGQRYNPMYPSPAPSSTTPVLPNASLSPLNSSNGITHTSAVTTLPTSVSDSMVMTAARQSLTPQVSPHLNAAKPNGDTLTTSWSPTNPSSSPSSTASMPAYLDNYEVNEN
ncbi:hypothetical protein EDD21DRAFT_171581 [Dissophora ornata]|nr:hypothetical protein EDD21DRAFT_171581 [Dissophora ornata]